MGTIKFSSEDVEKLLDGRYHSFIQDIHDTVHTIGSPQSITGGNPVLYTNNGGIPIITIAPTYITSRWNVTDNKIAFPDELNTPYYEAEIGFTFDPTAASEGLFTLRVYIDDATPKLIRTVVGSYKKDPEPHSVSVKWYLGNAVGYDAKNDGVYFELEFGGDGILYDKTLIIKRI